ncbi:hypothetical protein [Burkholderia phage BCSR5]|nr:hypothetical protein [Burkholderia phage BCSR5]
MHSIHPYLTPVISEASEKQRRYDQLYMDIALRCSDESVDKRRRVGAVVVKDNSIVAWGFNGTPANTPNECEQYALSRLNPCNPDSTLWFKGNSKPTVLHAEKNALLKLARSSYSAVGTTLYCTDCCCLACALDWAAAGAKELVYQYPYRLEDGLDHLRQQGVTVRFLGG